MRLFGALVLASACCFTTGFAPTRLVEVRNKPLQAKGVVVLHASVAKTVVGGAVASAVASVVASVKVVRQGDVAIVERLGKFRTKLNPGLHFLIPIVDRVRSTLTTREQVLDIPPQKCVTSDNAPLAADAVVYWRVVDVEKAVYAVVDVELAIQNLVLTQLRAEIGKLTLDMTFSARERLNSDLLRDLDMVTAPWGVKITRVEVRDIIPNQDILQAMDLQMAAERQKRAAIIKSEGDRDCSINEAQGEARSRIIDAEAAAVALKMEAAAQSEKLTTEAAGAAKAIEKLALAVGSANEAVRFQLMRDYVAAQRELATSDNAKVIFGLGADEIFAKAVGFYDGAASAKGQMLPSQATIGGLPSESTTGGALPADNGQRLPSQGTIGGVPSETTANNAQRLPSQDTIGGMPSESTIGGVPPANDRRLARPPQSTRLPPDAPANDQRLASQEKFGAVPSENTRAEAAPTKSGTAPAKKCPPESTGRLRRATYEPIKNWFDQ